MSTLGNLLSERRKRVKVTQAQLALMVGISLDMVSRIERDERRPSVETLFAVMSALGIPGSALTREIMDSTTKKEETTNGKA